MEIVDAHMHLWTTETHQWVAEAKNTGHYAGPFGMRALLRSRGVTVNPNLELR